MSRGKSVMLALGTLLAATALAAPVLGVGQKDLRGTVDRPVRDATEPTTRPASHFDVSPALTGIAAAGGPSGSYSLAGEAEEKELDIPLKGPVPDPVVQRTLGASGSLITGANFDGLAIDPSDPFLSITGIPPDTNGEIGPNHFVEMVNRRFAVFDRTGHLLLGPMNNNLIWKGFGGACESTNDGDPVVIYDQLADRWLLTQFSVSGPYYECVAISQTPDPTGAYYRYAFKLSDSVFHDYPKIAVWPDAYYLTTNEFDPADGLLGVGATALERDAMIAGNPGARMVLFDVPLTDHAHFGLLPADLDGHKLPPTGAPETFVHLGLNLFGGFLPELDLFHFHVDWSNPSASTFTPSGTVATAPYDANLCNFDRHCIAQKTSLNTVDALSDRLMFRAAYRNFGDHEALVVNHTVDVGGDQAGVRWYELRNVSANATLFQQGTYAPGAGTAPRTHGPSAALNRWLGSVAMDGNGDIGLGYSVSGSTLNPGVRYTARRAGDPAGQMTFTEGSLIDGAGANTETRGRWGDYSDLTVDPRDDCTFWYTDEYFPSNSDGRFNTRVGTFMVPGCDATVPTAKVNGSSGKAGKNVKITYQTADNSGQTREDITILRPNGKKLKTFQTALHNAGTFVLTIKAPKPPGTYTVQVVATDAKGNVSVPAKATLRST